MNSRVELVHHQRVGNGIEDSARMIEGVLIGRKEHALRECPCKSV